MPVAQVTLEDKYTRESGLIFLTGIQALARLAIVQNLRDRRAGHHTAGSISGAISSECKRRGGRNTVRRSPTVTTSAQIAHCPFVSLEHLQVTNRNGGQLSLKRRVSRLAGSLSVST